MASRILKFLSATAVLAALAGCNGTPPLSVDLAAPPAAPLSSGGPATFADALADTGANAGGGTMVRAKDRISVNVLREPQLSLESIRVGEDGFIDMPYVGRVRADGRATAEIAGEIRDRLGRDYLRNPHVAVNIVDFASWRVTVEGAVMQPGVYQFEPDTTLLGAVAMARGPVRAARLKQVAIFRTIGGERSVAVFDLSQVRTGRMIDPVIVPGDRILIGFDGLTQAWQDFLQSTPLIAAFTRF